VTDRKNGTTCSQFTVYTDDLPDLHEYIQSHNAGDGEFKVDIGGAGVQSGVFLQQYPKPV
jgi:hypothetical protein